MDYYRKFGRLDRSGDLVGADHQGRCKSLLCVGPIRDIRIDRP